MPRDEDDDLFEDEFDFVDDDEFDSDIDDSEVDEAEDDEVEDKPAAKPTKKKKATKKKSASGGAARKKVTKSEPDKEKATKKKKTTRKKKSVDTPAVDHDADDHDAAEPDSDDAILDDGDRGAPKKAEGAVKMKRPAAATGEATGGRGAAAKPQAGPGDQSANDDDTIQDESDEPGSADEYGRVQPQRDYVVHVYEHGKFHRTLAYEFTAEDAGTFSDTFNKTGRPYGRFAVPAKNDSPAKPTLAP
jgi:hypothetical protein